MKKNSHWQVSPFYNVLDFQFVLNIYIIISSKINFDPLYTGSPVLRGCLKQAVFQKFKPRTQALCINYFFLLNIQRLRIRIISRHHQIKQYSLHLYKNEHVWTVCSCVLSTSRPLHSPTSVSPSKRRLYQLTAETLGQLL